MEHHPPPPVISVIIAVYNVVDHLGAMIDSLRAQRFSAFEALVIDDGSTDGSREVLQSLCHSDPRFRVIHQPNAGLSAARNSGLDEARGEYVAFLDGDDALDPDFLRTLHQIIEREQTAWAACGVTLVYPDAHRERHSAFHGTPAQAPGKIDLTDARLTAKVFPSAWNKLYRRDAIGALRFTPGTWFEDHGFFWAFAAQYKSLSYSPRPLYLHRRGRAGQITGTDSERVFEQFVVLDQVKTLIETGGFENGEGGFARLATRLVHERAQAVRDPVRRARFLNRAQEKFTEWGIQFSPGDDPSINRALRLAMEGEVPLSVVIAPRDFAGLARVFPALAAQEMADFELLIIGDALPPEPPQLPSGQPVWTLPKADMAAVLSAASGAYVLFLGQGDVPKEDAFLRLINVADRAGTTMAMGGLERKTLGYHDGWTDNRVADRDGDVVAIGPDQALRLYPVLGNKLFRRDQLQDLPFPAGLVWTQAFVIQAALKAQRMAQTDLPVLTTPDFPAGENTHGLARQVQVMAGDSDALPEGWRSVILLRLYQLALGARAGFMGWLRVLWQAKGLSDGVPPPPDPQTPGWVRRLWHFIAGQRV